MRIKQIAVGCKIICNGGTAESISHGDLGCGVEVLNVKGEDPGVCLGNQIWSNNTIVTILKKDYI